MNLPTKITCIRLLLIPVFVALFLINFPYHYLVSAIVFAIATITDFFDGYLARKNHMVTNLGKFLDSAADKMLVNTALVLIMIFTTTLNMALYLLIVVCVVIITCRELLISCLRQLAASKNIIIAADKLGKYKATAEFISLSFLISYVDFTKMNATLGQVFFYIGFVLLIVSTILAIISAINYLYKYREAYIDHE